jgi:hypothetical protein
MDFSIARQAFVGKILPMFIRTRLKYLCAMRNSRNVANEISNDFPFFTYPFRNSAIDAGLYNVVGQESFRDTRGKTSAENEQLLNI